MNDENIVLIARLKVKKVSIEAAKRAALAIIQASRDEDGCINYDFHQSINDESVFIWHETWKNQEAIDAHGISKHFKEFGEAVANLTEEPLQLTFAKMVSEKGLELKIKEKKLCILQEKRKPIGTVPLWTAKEK